MCFKKYFKRAGKSDQEIYDESIELHSALKNELDEGELFKHYDLLDEQSKIAL